MRYYELLTEIKRKKKKRKKKRKSKPAYGGYWYPGFAFATDSSGGESGGVEESIDPQKDPEAYKAYLLKTLPYMMGFLNKVIKDWRPTEEQMLDAIDIAYEVMKKTSDVKVAGKAFQDHLQKLHKMSQGVMESSVNANLENEVEEFKDWAVQKLKIKNPPKIELSYDTEEAQEGHHTGRHVEGSDSIWVYANNRNLVDILRTVFHELVHVRQSELGMIGHGDSYPGSPIEAMADMLAGKYLKIYGKNNRKIFQ